MTPKEKGKRRRRVTMGGVSQWKTHQRLTYHIAECAMHLQMIKQILEEEDSLTDEILEHREQAGKRLVIIYKLCRKIYPEMLKQP